MADNFALKVSDTLREYLKEIRTALHDTEFEAERELQISSALEEIEGKEVKVATDVECSRILETLLEAAPTQLLLQLAERIATREDLFTIACNPFGSHVLEKVLVQLQHALGGDEPEKALRIVAEMVNLVKEDLIDYITHKFATFFARRLLQLLTGQLSTAALQKGSEKKQDIADKVKLIQQNSEKSGLEDGAGKCPQSEAGEDLAFKAEFEAHLHSFVQEVCGHGFDTATLISLQRSMYGSPFLQALLRAVTDKAQVATLICHMLGAPPEQSEQPGAAVSRLDPAPLVSQMKHKTASHMIEAIFLCCPAKLYDPLFKSLSNWFPGLCVNPIANYAAQSLIAAAPAARNVGDLFHTLKGSLEDCLLRGRSGVACLLVAACAAWRVECEDCCSVVQAAFPDGVIEGLAMLGQDKTLPEAIEAGKATRRPERLSVNGCLIIKSMLSMPQSACRGVTDAIVALDSAAVEFIASDPSGARVLETLLKGSAPKPVKRKVVGLLKGSYLKLAKLGAASRFVESLFMWCDVSDKELIAQPLAEHLTELKASKFGEPLCQAFQLDLFRSGADEWRKRMHSSEKIKAQYEKLFADSIAKEAKAKRKSKKRKGNDDADVPAQSHHHASGSHPHPNVKHHAPNIAAGDAGDHFEGVSGSAVEDQLPDGGVSKEGFNPNLNSKAKSKKSKKRPREDAAQQEDTEQNGTTSVQPEVVAGSEEHGDVGDGGRKKKHDRKNRGDKKSRKSVKKASREGERGQEIEGVTGETLKPATDAKSVVDEVMAELAIGSSGGKKKSSSKVGVGKDAEKRGKGESAVRKKKAKGAGRRQE